MLSCGSPTEWESWIAAHWQMPTGGFPKNRQRAPASRGVTTTCLSSLSRVQRRSVTCNSDRMTRAQRSLLFAYDRILMAYDEGLADRIRELLGGEARLTEKKMFGGLAFLIGGNMAVAASGQGGVLVRVDPSVSDKLVAGTNARLMEMRGRRMQGWLRVDPDDVRTKRQLARWVKLGTSFARSLPAKR
jgi:TfoX/Sxy family transcriptional regulator of competence genes